MSELIPPKAEFPGHQQPVLGQAKPVGELTIASEEFRAPFIRVRGRIARTHEMTLDYSLRTYRPPNKHFLARSGRSRVGLDAQATRPVDESAESLVRIELVAEDRQILKTGYTVLDFVFAEARWGAFMQRLPFAENARWILIYLQGHLVGHVPIVPMLPQFLLHAPSQIDPQADTCTLHWESSDPQASKYRYYVRYTADGTHWYRPAVNLTKTQVSLDLRDLPAGEACVISVLANNGYHTAVASTQPFLRRVARPAKILLGQNEGPVLFAQGFSLEHGPIPPSQVRWMVDDTDVIGDGGTFDVRTVGKGVHVISVWIDDPAQGWTQHQLGTFDCATGLKVIG